MDPLSTLAVIVSGAAAVLAWLAKLRWSKEYGAAKDAVIKAKEEQIQLLKMEVESLQRMTPMKIREYFESVKKQLEEYNDRLQSEVAAAEELLRHKDVRLSQLEAQLQVTDTEVLSSLARVSSAAHAPFIAGASEIKLKFESMEDFSPESILEKVPELKQLLESRRDLEHLLALMSHGKLAEDLSIIAQQVKAQND
jgi:hypothetical protein